MNPTECTTAAEGLEPGEVLRQAVEHTAHLLPSQGPITVFVHHNTLHSFEHLPFDEAVRNAKQIYGCEPYLSEDRYRQEVRRGRIRAEDLFHALTDDLGERGDVLLGFQGTRFHLRLAMLKYHWGTSSSAGLRWVIAESDALRRFRSDAPAMVRDRIVEETQRWVTREVDGIDLSESKASKVNGGPTAEQCDILRDCFERFDRERIAHWNRGKWEGFCLDFLWRVCVAGIRRATHDPPLEFDRGTRHREMLMERTGRDSDKLVHELLIRFCAAYMDQGVARWQLPDRELGFWAAFKGLYGHSMGVADRWLRGLAALLEQEGAGEWSASRSIQSSLRRLGVPVNEWGLYVERTLLALRGWGGILWQLETAAPWTPHPAPPGSLWDFLAVRLLLDRLAVTHVAEVELGYRGPLEELRGWLRQGLDAPESRLEERAFMVFQLAQVLGWSPKELSRLSPVQWKRLWGEIEEFSEDERRRVFHAAYERRYRMQALDALAIHAAHVERPRTVAPRGQVVCCIDDREESFRRHLEEISTDVETLGTAGFFAVPMYYRGVEDAHYIPLCPVVVTPRHYVDEKPIWTLEPAHQRQAETRRRFGHASHQVSAGSHTIWFGALTAFLGTLASFPLIMRVLFPRLSARITERFNLLVRAPRLTYLELERIEATPGIEEDHHGFSLDEMADMVERLLRDLGLTSGFARIILIFGHGSSSLNNPHESAYNCGACGGGRGGPNARAMASMANDPRVRTRLAERGLELPEHVVFVGAYHNTCNDSVRYFDLDRIPATHRRDFLWLRGVVDEARERNAHERCRWFRSADLYLSNRDALRHVEARSEDLAQVRPEYNHATNALCVVGRRRRTRGLFLDRRAFLCSYDPTQDNEQGAILARILQAVIPVCSGISLEYYFSCVDPDGYGCGSKLPHNITSLLGVMDGAASDLRPGLSRQMVETHEPMRLIFVIESSPRIVRGILDNHPALGQLCRNGWIRVAVLDPESAQLWIWQDAEFQSYQPESDRLPKVERSQDWYRGWRDHLGFAEVASDAGTVSAPTSTSAAKPAMAVMETPR